MGTNTNYNHQAMNYLIKFLRDQLVFWHLAGIRTPDLAYIITTPFMLFNNSCKVLPKSLKALPKGFGDVFFTLFGQTFKKRPLNYEV
ncbi:hypothetical protein MTR_6g460720 [Medicago truncatula]|uniref:Uncharacterized protein n=1 Tax=Medicago truncatula TaxID=3880 RepID=A0A072UAL2_MEDTR|nr:hypothetical protein MTR_6g460720 [Medicago truncatula]